MIIQLLKYSSTRQRTIKKHFVSILVIAFSCQSLSFADVQRQPIVIEGVVPNAIAKDRIISQLKTLYPNESIVDRVQIRPVAAPEGWAEAVSQLIRPDLKTLVQGKLDVNGTLVRLSGTVADPEQMRSTQSIYQGLVLAPYQLNMQLSGQQAEQKVIDDTLKNRIIEFESGSAILTASGIRILDEMVIALNKVQGKNIKVIGHTDNVGNPQQNLRLSQQRAEAVKNYLMSKNIAASRLSLEGKGAQQPVADNATVEGRQKNRRIEFIVL